MVPGLWNPNFRLYFTARTVATLGDAMLPVAQVAGMIQMGFGPGDIGLAVGSFMAFFGGLVIFGGVFADRFNARALMIGADLVRVATQSAVAVMYATGQVTLWQLCLVGAVNGTAAAMFQPGVASTVPRVAADVQQGNGVLRTAEALMTLGGPAVAGLMVGLSSPAGVFCVHAATYAVSALCLGTLRLAPPADAEPGKAAAGRTSFRADLAEGWREFTARTWLWSVIALWMLLTLVVLGPLTPVAGASLVSEHGAGAYGLVNSALGAGGVLGGLVALRLRPRKPLRAGALALVGYALFPVAVGTHLPLWAVCGCVLVAGTGWAFWGVMWATSVQTQIPPDILNRIHSYEVAGSMAMFPVGQALAGPGASLLGSDALLLGSGCVALLVCAALLAVPAVRGLARAAD
nr:MFS transporter [Streptomyces actinomycinicus]